MIDPKTVKVKVNDAGSLVLEAASTDPVSFELRSEDWGSTTSAPTADGRAYAEVPAVAFARVPEGRSEVKINAASFGSDVFVDCGIYHFDVTREGETMALRVTKQRTRRRSAV